MHHVLPYNVTAGVNDVNVDMTGIADPEFSRRSGHFILSEPYKLIGMIHHGVSALRVRFNVPSINKYGRHLSYPVDRNVAFSSPQLFDDYTDQDFMLPVDEEIALEESGNLGAATEQEDCFLFIAPLQWNRNLPPGQRRLTIRCSQAVVNVAQGWSALTALTFSDNLLGGWYAVVGAFAQQTNGLIFRLVFPRTTQYMGRKLRPGGMISQSQGNIPWYDQGGRWGEWGRFHSFEPPQIETYANTAGSQTLELRLDLVYLGEGQSAMGGMGY